MSSTSYSLDIGEFRCTIVSDGYILVPVRTTGSAGVDNAEPEYQKMDISCLLIENGKRKILIDTGCGSGFQDTAGDLLKNLGEIEVHPSEIDTIVYTHGHEDHVGGTFDSDGHPVFPEARQVVSKKEWAGWLSRPETPLNENLFASARRHLLTIPDRFELVDDNYELMPGLQLVPALGHTLGGIMIGIASGGKALLCIGDLIHNFDEFTHPDMYSFLDAAPDEALKLRTAGLRKMAESGIMVFACHFPFPGIGRFTETNGSLGWQPIKEQL